MVEHLLLDGHVGELFATHQTVEFVVRVKLGLCRRVDFAVLFVRDGAFLGLHVVGRVSEGSLPVLLVQVGVVYFVLGAGTWRWVSVLDVLVRLVVVVTFQPDTGFEASPPVDSRLVQTT